MTRIFDRCYPLFVLMLTNNEECQVVDQSLALFVVTGLVNA